MAGEKATMTAPRAIIKDKNMQTVGYIRNFRCTEQINRGTVKGVGRVTPSEVPVLSINCTWSCDQYLIDLVASGIKGLDNRQLPQKAYQDTLVLGEVPVDVYIFKNEATTTVGGVVIETAGAGFVIIRDIYLNTRGWDITEDQVSMHNQSGVYLEPAVLG